MDPDENREINLYFSVLSPFTTVTSVGHNFFCFISKGFFFKKILNNIVTFYFLNALETRFLFVRYSLQFFQCWALATCFQFAPPQCATSLKSLRHRGVFQLK